MPANKLGRRARALKGDTATAAFVRNKWNGKESIEVFNAREQKLYSAIPETRKRVFVQTKAK